jgi:hypothetical protein
MGGDQSALSPRPSQEALHLNLDHPEASNNCPPPKAHTMDSLLNFFKSGPEAMKGMAGLVQQIA